MRVPWKEECEVGPRKRWLDLWLRLIGRARQRNHAGLVALHDTKASIAGILGSIGLYETVSIHLRRAYQVDDDDLSTQIVASIFDYEAQGCLPSSNTDVISVYHCEACRRHCGCRAHDDGSGPSKPRALHLYVLRYRRVAWCRICHSSEDGRSRRLLQEKIASCRGG